MSLVCVDDLSISYSVKTVLSHVSLSIEPGEIVTIVEPNGSGKTSMLRAIIESVKPARGRVTRGPNVRVG